MSSVPKGLKRGDLVRMKHTLKSAFKANLSGEHVRLYGRRVGVVLGPVDYGNGVFGPEVDVRWKVSRNKWWRGGKYGYHPDQLQVVRRC